MLSRFSPTWWKHRSLLKHALSPQVVKRDYLALLTKKAEEYVECVLTRPEEFLADLNKYAEAAIMSPITAHAT